MVLSAEEILTHHPALENVFIDLTPANGSNGSAIDRRKLADAADRVAQVLDQSGLARVQKVSDTAAQFPAFLDQVAHNLPVLFSENDLEIKARPLLSRTDRMKKDLQVRLQELYSMESVGRAGMLRADPLSLSNLVLARLGGLAPGQGGDIFRGHVFSADGKHALVMARPAESSRDTAANAALAELLDKEAASLAASGVDLLYAGAMRAALDNEAIVKKDAQRAVLVVTVGLAVLILAGFRRPWIGLLSIWPAACGLLLATFVYSLISRSIFALALGFGAALISIAVDHALAYILALDRGRETEGAVISHEVWSVASFTVYTTAAALLVLTLSGVPLFSQVGLFAALGVLLAAGSVHVFFPLLFPRLKPSARRPLLPVGRWMDRLARSRGLGRTAAALLVGVVLAFCINTNFSTDLGALNTVSPATTRAEARMAEVWGDLSGRTYIMARADDLDRLRDRAGDMDALMESWPGLAGQGPALAGLMPGAAQREYNLAAWKKFWTPELRAQVRGALNEAAEEFGLTADAFQPFFDQWDAENPAGPQASPGLLEVLGVFSDPEGGQMLITAAAPGDGFDAESFFGHAAEKGFQVFNPDHFSRSLAGRLNKSFLSMLAVISVAALVLLFFLFVDIYLVVLTAAPLAFALVGTLGAHESGRRAPGPAVAHAGACGYRPGPGLRHLPGAIPAEIRAG